MAGLTRSHPWQLEWKQPTLQLLSSSDAKSASNIVDYSAAWLRKSEVLLCNNDIDGLATSNSEQLLLTVTAISSSSKNNYVGDQIQIELYEPITSFENNGASSTDNDVLLPEDGNSSQVLSTRGQATCLLSKILRWPSSALEDQSMADTSQRSFWQWRGAKKNTRARSGVVAATLYRQPFDDSTNTVADALDVLQFMSLGLTANSVSVSKETDSGATEPRMMPASNIAKGRDECTMNIMLACLTNEGTVHCYDLESLIGSVKSSKTIDNTVAWDNGMASLLLGNMVLDVLNNSILPLAHPVSTIKLPLGRHAQLDVDKRNTTADNDNVNMVSNLRYDEVSSTGMWDISLWDSNVDASTLPWKSKHNRATLVSATREYMCIAGSGERLVRYNHVSDNSDNASNMSNDVFACEGGFITLISWKTLTSVRTLFLPFNPKQIAPLYWQDISWVLIIGDQHAALVRLDSPHLGAIAPDKVAAQVESLTQEQAKDPIRRFQIVPLVLPVLTSCDYISASISESSLPSVIISSVGANAVTITYHSFAEIRPTKHEEMSPIWHTTDNTRRDETTVSAVILAHESRHSATIAIGSNIKGRNLISSQCSGQGWSMIMIGAELFFVCWEGATVEQRPFICKLYELKMSEQSEVLTRIGAILGFDPFCFSDDSLGVKDRDANDEVVDTNVDKINDDAVSTDSRTESDFIGKHTAIPSMGRRSVPQIGLKRETTIGLLQKCVSWTHLEETKESKLLFDKQQPVLCLCLLSPTLSYNLSLSLRALVVRNKQYSQFYQVLSWLSQCRDYFTAASIALDLLSCREALRHLWYVYDKAKDNEETNMLSGLLDGIAPISIEDEKSVQPLKQLADMTVGCLIKGGYLMSSTLQIFLRNNSDYSPMHACLMLAGTFERALSRLNTDDLNESSDNSGNHGYDKRYEDSFLWPVRCLLEVGTSREFLSQAIDFLNNVIPDELRARPGEHPPIFVSGIELCKKLVSMILLSSPDAIDILMNLGDDKSSELFWFSLAPETRLELSVLKVGDTYPVILHDVVRSWVHELLSYDINHLNNLNAPSNWLRNVIAACLVNIRCDFDSFKEITAIDSAYLLKCDIDVVDMQYKNRGIVRRVLNSSTETHRPDYGTLISALLLLESRQLPWSVRSPLPTQSLLIECCHIAGRKGHLSTVYGFDSKVVMQQCYITNNIQAGANFVGGTNGFTLECCHILVKCECISVEQAEQFLLGPHSLNLLPKRGGKAVSTFSHELNRLLLLLDEHVLSIRYYGQFVVQNKRKEIDPVFAAKCCLKTWWLVTRDEKISYSKWFEDWLSNRLGMATGNSPHRLACAALSQALLWRNTDDLILANQVGFSGDFLVKLSLSCCGMTEAIPYRENDDQQVRDDFPISSSSSGTAQNAHDTSIDESFETAASSLPVT